jgi:hypothetical protein
MQLFRNEVFSAPNSFFVLASLRQAVRFACLAAASPDAGADAVAETAETADADADAEAGDVAVAAGVGGTAGASLKPSAIAHRVRDKAAAKAAKLEKSRALMHPRIASLNCRTDEARMKLA